MANRLTKSDTVTVSGTPTTTATTYGYDAANRLTTLNGNAAAYANDADGNTLTGGGRTNAWDSQNRLVSCAYNGGAASTYTYGADGLRRSATVNGVTTYFVYDGQTMIREMKKNAQNVLYPIATYLQGPRGGECRVDETQQTEGYLDATNTAQIRGKTSWYVYDGLGSVVAEVAPDAAGTVTSSPKYDVYGAVRSNSGTASSKQGFVGSLGHLSEPETGLIYMRARFYDPTIGRFASEDSSKNGSNWYCYADNNPTCETDKDGHSALNIVEGTLEATLGLMLICLGAEMISSANLSSTLESLQYAIGQIKGGVNQIKAFIPKAGAALGMDPLEASLFAMVTLLQNDEFANGMLAALGGAGAKAGAVVTGYSLQIWGTYMMIEGEETAATP